MAGHALELDYVFEPASVRDGINLRVPAPLVGVLRDEQIDWLVPGRLPAKVLMLLRGLPKDLRRPLVPLPDAAERLVAEFFAIRKGLIWDIQAVMVNRDEDLPSAWPPDYGPTRGGWAPIACDRACLTPYIDAYYAALLANDAHAGAIDTLTAQQKHAYSGLGATTDFLDKALDWVAAHTPDDHETQYLEATVTGFRNTRGPEQLVLRSAPRPEAR